MQQVEQRAMMFFWYFFLVARYLGQFLVLAFLDIFFRGESVETVFTKIVTSIANTIPKSLGPTALSYLLTSTFLTWPLFYLLQAATVGTKLGCLFWINRIMKGGGNGTLVPYRIYID